MLYPQNGDSFVTMYSVRHVPRIFYSTARVISSFQASVELYLSSLSDSGIGFFSVLRGRRDAEATITALPAAVASSLTDDRAGLAARIAAARLGVFQPPELELPAPKINQLISKFVTVA